MTINPSLKDDIAYVRALAEEGQKPGFQGGPILITAGLGWGAASLVQWAVSNGNLPGWAAWAWPAPLPVFFLVMIAVGGKKWRADSQGRATGW